MDKKSNHFTSVIFDLDGTLIDTELAAAEAVNICFNEWNLNVDPNDASYVTGRTWDSAFEFLFNKYTLPVSETVARKKIKDFYREILEQKLTIVPGAVRAVQSIATQYQLGLVSGSSRLDILWALKKLEIIDLFQVVLGAEDYPRSKPHADGYLKAAEILKAKPSSCLVFEDSSPGIQSAISAGMSVVAVTSTNHFKQDHSLAHFKVENLSPVNAEWIQSLLTVQSPVNSPVK